MWFLKLDYLGNTEWEYPDPGSCWSCRLTFDSMNDSLQLINMWCMIKYVTHKNFRQFSHLLNLYISCLNWSKLNPVDWRFSDFIIHRVWTSFLWGVSGPTELLWVQMSCCCCCCVFERLITVQWPTPQWLGTHSSGSTGDSAHSHTLTSLFCLLWVDWRHSLSPLLCGSLCVSQPPSSPLPACISAPTSAPGREPGVTQDINCLIQSWGSVLSYL